MAIFTISCCACSCIVEFKYKSRFDRANKKNYICLLCRHKLSIINKTRSCPKCGVDIVCQSPSSRNRAEKKGSNCKNCCSNQIPNAFSDLQLEIVNGLLLGDGSIPDTKRPYKRLSVTRQIKDRGYMFWHYEIMQDFFGTPPKYFKSYHNKAKKFYEGYACRTKSGKLFQVYRNKWYVNGKKIVPKDIVITPYVLLVWFLDDGCIIKKSNHLTIKFATDGFSKEDTEFLAHLLLKTFNIELGIYKNGNGFILKGSTKPAKKIIDIIEPIFPLCMIRKKTWI